MIIAYWHWLVFGFAMMAAELLAPGAFFLWVGLAALSVGGLSLIIPSLSSATQLFLFGGLALAITILGRQIVRFYSRQAPPSILNRRGQQLIGEILTLDAPILNGHAHITVGDSKWRVKGPDLPSGACVKIIGIDGTQLIVEIEDK